MTRVCRSRRTRRPRRVVLCGQAPALGVGEPETARTELLSADAILFLERVNDVTRLRVDPARDGHDEELQHLGNRRHTGRAEQRLSVVTNVATRRASSVESARPSRIRCQAATGSWTKSRQWETQRTLFSSTRATVWPPAKVNGV